MATYAPKYTFDFVATNGDGIQILILQKGRTGLPMSRSLGRAPILKREKSGCVFGTSIEIYAECKVDGEFADLYTSSADEYKVEVYKKPINSNIIQMKIWEGFVSPELYSEPEIAPPYDVQIIATDGLGELKNYTFESAGEVTVRAHLDAMLAHTGLSANYNLVSQLDCGGNGMLDVVLDLAHLNGESCYDALKAVLDSFHACISLHDCQWMIWRETDFATMASSQNVAVFGSMAVAQWWPCGQLSATIMPARNEATIVSESSYKENVLKDVQTQMSGNASYDEAGKTYILPAQYSAVTKSLAFGEEVGYKLALALTARNYGSGEDEQPLGIKVEIDGRSYAAGDKFWLALKKDGNPAWYNAEASIEQSLAAPSSSDDESNAQTYVLVLPLYRYDNRAYHYATSVKVTIFNPSGVYPIYVHDISLVKAEQGKGYKSIVTIANGAREKADEVEVSIAASERMPAAAKVFMQGVALNGSGELIAAWKSSRLEDSGYLSFMSRDYALSSALPRMQVQGVLNVPRGTLNMPVLFKRDNTYYFPEKYNYDLLNDEISVSLMSIPTATISVVSENVTELAAETAAAGAQSGAGGGTAGGGGGLNEGQLEEYLQKNNYLQNEDLTQLLAAYFTGSKAKDADKLDGNDSTYYATAAALNALLARQIIAGNGLSGGGSLAANRTISLQYLGGAGTYYKVTVDEYGRVTMGEKALTAADIPNIPASKIIGLEEVLEALDKPIDVEMSDTSENAVQNKIIKAYADLHSRYEKVEDVEDPGIVVYATQEWVRSQSYATQEWVQQQNYMPRTSFKTINGQSIIGTGDITITGSGDIDLTGYATQSWVQQQNYVTESTLNYQISQTRQYVDQLRIDKVRQQGITQLTMYPDTLYILSEIETLTIQLTNQSSQYVNHYMLELVVGDTVPDIIIPEGIMWMDGYNWLQNLKPNKTYHISIMDNTAVGGVFE